MEKKTYTLDVNGKKLGRVATEIANILNGKTTPMYVPNKIPNVKVVIENVDKLALYPREMTQKKYIHYTGYTAGLRTKTMRQVIEKHGVQEILRKAVYGMVPSNRLRKEKMKCLVINS